MANKSNGKKSKTKSAPVHEEMSTSEEMIIDVERTFRAIAAKYGMSDDERNELFRSISMICMAQLARGEGPFYDIAHGGGLVQ